MSAVGAAAVAILSSLAAAGAPDASPDPRAASPKDLISRTILSADVTGDGLSEQVVLVNILGAGRQPERALDVQVGVYDAAGRRLWARSVLETDGGPCFGGEMALVDLEGNGSSEIVLTYGTSEGPERWERRAQVFRWERGVARLAWGGVVRLDTSRDAATPGAERTVFRAEIDVARTLAARGGTLFLRKTVTMAAGVPLEAPRVIVERAVLPPREAAR